MIYTNTERIFPLLTATGSCGSYILNAVDYCILPLLGSFNIIREPISDIISLGPSGLM